MATRVLNSREGIGPLADFLGARDKFPLTITITQGAARRDRQNRLAQRWFTDVSRQKEAFRQSYDRTMRPLDYETKLEAMEHLDLPVTRLMTVKQMTAFMDEMQRHWCGLGFRLTDPAALRYEEDFA